MLEETAQCSYLWLSTRVWYFHCNSTIQLLIFLKKNKHVIFVWNIILYISDHDPVKCSCCIIYLLMIDNKICYSVYGLTHWGRVRHICISDANHATSHYLNLSLNIVNWTIRNKLQWNFNQNSYIFIQEIAFENVLCKLAAILSQPQCVND